MLKEKIGIIGAGKIGSAIVRGMINAGLVARDQVIASDVSDALRQSIAKELGIEVTPDNGKVCDFADSVILAVKPQIVDAVLKEVAKQLGKAKLLVSVAAGVPLSRLETHLVQGARVVRVMPNIPCVVEPARRPMPVGHTRRRRIWRRWARFSTVLGSLCRWRKNIWTR